MQCSLGGVTVAAMPTTPNFLSLFDGCHMFGLALRRAGFECVGTSEIEKHARAVTRYHYLDTPQLGDVTNVRPTQPFDLLVGGFPCQDLSVAGARRGLAGERSGLFWEIVRIARESSPRWLLLENVPGLLSSNGGRDMGAVIGALGELGYGVAWRVLDAQYFGVPQRRRRVFIVGCRGDVRSAGKVLFESESVRGDSPPSRETGEGATGKVAKRLTAHGHRLDGETETFVAVGGDISHTLTGEGHDASEDGSGRGTPIVVADMVQITSATNRSNPKPGVSSPTLTAHSRLTAFNWRVNNLSTSSVSPCLDADGSGSIAANVPFTVSLRGRDGGATAEMGGTVASALRSSQGGGDKAFVSYRSRVRRLMPVECERLQGLPDDWTRHGRREDGTVYELSDSARYKMIGNGGAVPVVEWITQRILAT